MAQRHLEWAERMVELWNSGDLEAWLDEVGSDFEFTPDPSFPDENGDAGLIKSRWHLAAPGSGGQIPVADFTLVVFWEGPDAARPNRMASFFDHEQALRLAEETG